MAYRGRGRGRGGWRGAPSYVPMARGDDGVSIIAAKMDAPPPLFPPMNNLPNHKGKDTEKEYEELLTRRRRLETFWNASPYYIEKPKEKSIGMPVEIEKYSDKYKPNYKTKRPPLSSVLKLTSAYFPAELLGQQAERKHGRDGQYKGTLQWTLDSNLRKMDLRRLDRLETLEQRSEKNSEEVEGKEEGKKEGDEGDDDEEELEEEEEEEIGQDDYAQNFGFDDDDDYLDDDDGGDDEGPTY